MPAFSLSKNNQEVRAVLVT